MKIKLNIPYVYIFKNPLKNNIPFYIGKGRNYRYTHHLSPCILADGSYKSRTILKILRNQLQPTIEIIYCKTDTEALTLESDLISKYKKSKDGGTLVNFLDGGDITPSNSGELHPLFGSGGKFLLTNIKTKEVLEVIGLYFWAKQRKLNGTALVEVADKILIKTSNGKTTIRKQHKGWICERMEPPPITKL